MRRFITTSKIITITAKVRGFMACSYIDLPAIATIVIPIPFGHFIPGHHRAASATVIVACGATLAVGYRLSVSPNPQKSLLFDLPCLIFDKLMTGRALYEHPPSAISMIKPLISFGDAHEHSPHLGRGVLINLDHIAGGTPKIGQFGYEGIVGGISVHTHYLLTSPSPTLAIKEGVGEVIVA
jgi:hypothetical protein